MNICRLVLRNRPRCVRGLHSASVARRLSAHFGSEHALSSDVQDIEQSQSQKFERLLSLCKQRALILPSSHLYGGLSGSFDYGPLGLQLKNNIQQLWWEDFVLRRGDTVGIDTPVILSPHVWHATDHVSRFVDPTVACSACGTRARADHVLESLADKSATEAAASGDMEAIAAAFTVHGAALSCSSCGQEGAYAGAVIEESSLMLRTRVGVDTDTYLRPETAQGIFMNFQRVSSALRRPLPCGIAQIGKAFRNEVHPQNFIFRMREFEQMEVEYFCDPSESAQHYERWKDECMRWLVERVGLRAAHVRLEEHASGELAHYATASADVQYAYAHGWAELCGVAHRGDFDLQRHAASSGHALEHVDARTGEKVMPHCIEPSLGVERLLLAVLLDAYTEQAVTADGKDVRAVLRLAPHLAPFTVAVLPLMRKPPLLAKARDIERRLREQCSTAVLCTYDETGSIGKRYRRQDEIGTPFCVTVDFDTLENDTVTVRERDTMAQCRVSVDELCRACD